MGSECRCEGLQIAFFGLSCGAFADVVVCETLPEQQAQCLNVLLRLRQSGDLVRVFNPQVGQLFQLSEPGWQTIGGLDIEAIELQRLEGQMGKRRQCGQGLREWEAQVLEFGQFGDHLQCGIDIEVHAFGEEEFGEVFGTCECDGQGPKGASSEGEGTQGFQVAQSIRQGGEGIETEVDGGEFFCPPQGIGKGLQLIAAQVEFPHVREVIEHVREGSPLLGNDPDMGFACVGRNLFGQFRGNVARTCWLPYCVQLVLGGTCAACFLGLEVLHDQKFAICVTVISEVRPACLLD